VTISFSGIRRNAAQSLAQDTLKKAVSVMLSENVENGSYPSLFPSNLTAPDAIGLALTDTGSSSTFCINVTSSEYSDVTWHARQDQVITEGLCTEAVIVGSIIGDYTDHDVDEEPITSIGDFTGSGGGFEGVTNDNWTEITLSWDSVPDASRYEVQLRSATNGTWMLRRIADDAGNPNAPISSYQNNTAFSAHIPANTTSITWHGGNALPQIAGATFEYQYRAYSSSGVAGQWHSGSLAVPSGPTLATISSFTHTMSADWTNADFNWAVTNNRMPAPMIEIQLRSATNGTWMLRRVNDTAANPNGSIGTYVDDSAFSARIPITTSSINWKGQYALPMTVGQTYEYQIRVKSSTISGLYTNWTPLSISAPTLASQPLVTGLSASPQSSWSGVTLNWNAPNTSSTPSPVVEVQLRSSPTGTWMLRRVADAAASANGSVAGYNDDAAFSAKIPTSTTQLNWEGIYATPAAGQTFEYRIRIKSTTVTNLWGDWSTIQLSR